MELCGCHLREVGTTNKTHLSDYERAIGEQTRALLKVHTSNYRIVGFTESLPLSDIVALGCRTGLPVVEDLGSGSLVDLEHYGIHDEPTVQNSIRAGVDVVSFSGDKLLGGPQAGIILGKKPYIDRMKRHPLARAIRVDKMTIAALWATLTTYQDLHRAEQEIPTLAMLAVSGEDLRASAAQLCALLKERGGGSGPVRAGGRRLRPHPAAAHLCRGPSGGQAVPQSGGAGSALPGKAHHRPHHRGPAAAGRADHLPGGHGVYR